MQLEKVRNCLFRQSRSIFESIFFTYALRQLMVALRLDSIKYCPGKQHSSAFPVGPPMAKGRHGQMAASANPPDDRR